MVAPGRPAASTPQALPTPPARNPGMGLSRRLADVQRAEVALTAGERRLGADLRQFRRSWRAAWTPARIVLAGLAAGFVAGRADPSRGLARGNGLLRLMSMLSTLIASTGARTAATQAERAAGSAEEVAETAPRDTPAPHRPQPADMRAHEPAEP